MRVFIGALMACLIANAAWAAGFRVVSRDIADGATLPRAQVFDRDGCSGGNVSPQIAWSGEPVGTRSFAVTMFDPDAPGGHGWWHWTVFNIPRDVHDLPSDAGAPGSRRLPAGAEQGRNDFGLPGYGGACPPRGDPSHRYVITVYALKLARLRLPFGASGAAVETALRRNAIATAHITARYATPPRD